MPNPHSSTYTGVPVEISNCSDNPVELDSIPRARLNLPNPLYVDHNTKPTLSELHRVLDGNGDVTPVQNPVSTSLSSTPSTPTIPSTPSTMLGGKLGVNNPATSSVYAEIASVPSNIHELPGLTTNSPVSLPINHENNTSQISFYSGRDSSNTSLISETGSVTPNRYDTNDYPGPWPDDNQISHSPISGVHSHDTNVLDISYLAATPESNLRYDYTERVIAKAGLFGELRVGFKSFSSKVDGVYIKYHEISKGKLYWNLWEKTKSRYNTYEEFKANWDVYTSI